ncbi:MAG: hypothetical protein ACLSHC_12645 [Bilophila wadsworthia]
MAPAFYAAAKAPRLQDSISETMDKAKKDGKELGSKLGTPSTTSFRSCSTTP